MDSDEEDPLEAPVKYPDDDSGSAYENSDSEQPSPQQLQRYKAPNPRASSRASSRRAPASRSQTQETSTTVLSSDSESASEEEEEEEPAVEDDPELREQAEKWAANFKPPESPSQIQTPERRARRKRRASKTGCEIRAKRLKSYYNAEYRELLNSAIQEASTKILQEDKESFKTSQLGVSIWTAWEKTTFFSALSRLGRDDIRGIAERIGTKSETEVHEYIRLLHQESTGHQDGRYISYTDISPAIQVSEECCAVLDRAGDALASRQERREAQVEGKKWGEAWLVTDTVARQLDKHRKGAKGEEEFDEAFPAANLFHLNNWLELSEKVFMNPGAPHEEDNWRNLAEQGEIPAIRATALEDFHSLTVSITKRIISTVLFCTMSRQRAMSWTKKTKHAEISSDDVEAALEILGLPKGGQDFWIKSARRNHLRVINDESAVADKPSILPYDEVEAILSSLKRTRPRSRSRSRSRSQSRSRSRSMSCSTRHASIASSHRSTGQSSGSDEEPSDSSIVDSDDISMSELETDSSTSQASTTQLTTSSHKGGYRKSARARKAAERAHERYIEALDTNASKKAEQELWRILDQDPPFELEGEEVVEPQGKAKLQGGSDWRTYMEYWCEWEVFERPVERPAFEKNRVRMERKRKEKDDPEKEGIVVNEGSPSEMSEDDEEEEVEVGKDDIDAHETQSEDGHEDEESERDEYGARIERDENHQIVVDGSDDEQSMSDGPLSTFHEEWLAQQTGSNSYDGMRIKLEE
ncbi:hypothetical protein B0J14DRAFT_591127 [Halenospora varia]|nr:hypothetical protein B0J14DRAFT_591127 [Halenospora varia]